MKSKSKLSVWYIVGWAKYWIERQVLIIPTGFIFMVRKERPMYHLRVEEAHRD
jgi:hypothetical protein